MIARQLYQFGALHSVRIAGEADSFDCREEILIDRIGPVQECKIIEDISAGRLYSDKIMELKVTYRPLL